MAGQNAIYAEGRIVEALPKRLFRVELPNGHRLLGHAAQRDKAWAESLAVGDTVTVELSPYDLASGRILKKEN
jgi:translation initiation factor IF-1